MDELEEKAQTVLVGRAPIAASAQGPTDMCSVDGCLHQAAVICEVKVANMQLNPDNETHVVRLCLSHEKGFQTLKWEWRRTPDATSARLKLDGVFALDATEGT